MSTRYFPFSSPIKLPLTLRFYEPHFQTNDGAGQAGTQMLLSQMKAALKSFYCTVLHPLWHCTEYREALSANIVFLTGRFNEKVHTWLRWAGALS